MMMYEQPTTPTTSLVSTTEKQQRPRLHCSFRINEAANEYFESSVSAATETVEEEEDLLRELRYSRADYKSFRSSTKRLVYTLAQAESFHIDSDAASFTNVLLDTYGACCESTSTGKKPMLTSTEQMLLRQVMANDSNVPLRLGLATKIIHEIGHHRSLLRYELHEVVAEIQCRCEHQRGYSELLRRECERRSHVARWFAHLLAVAQCE